MGVFPGEADCEIVVADAPLLHGRVLDPAGKGVAGAAVALRSYRGGDQHARAVETRSGEEGRYSLRATALLSGRADARFLDVTAEGFAPRRDPLARIDGRQPGESEDIEHDVRLERGRRVSGRVVTHREGAPLAGIEVLLHRFAGRSVCRVLDERGFTRQRRSPLGPTPLASDRTDAEGRFAFGGVPTGRLDGEARGRDEGWGVVEVRGGGRAAAAVTLPRGAEDVTDLEIPVLPGIRLFGRVLESDGTPAPGARIGLRVEVARMVHVQPNAMYSRDLGFDDAWSPGKGIGYLQARSDAQGRFAFPPVPRPAGGGRLGRLVLSRAPDDPRGGGWREPDLRVPGAEEHDLGDLRFPPPSDFVELEILTRDEGGAPLFGVALTLKGRASGITDLEGRLVLPLRHRRTGRSAGTRPSSHAAAS